MVPHRSEAVRQRVLVTGLGGFTGRYVGAELAAAGHAVFPLEQPDDGSRIDLLDADAVREAVRQIQPQAVIHLAGIAFAAHGDAEALYRTNIVGTRHLLSALAELPERPARVVLASSAHVYGNATDERPLDEASKLQPASDYAVSKLAMEYMARTWSDRLPLLLTRPFNYTGVGQDQHFLVPKIVEHFRRGERRIELGNIDVWREFMDVRAVAWSYRRLLETEGGGDLFNLCSGSSHSLRDILDTMARIAGYTIEVVVNPAFVRSNEVRRLEGDGTRLQRRIGEPPVYALEDTLRWMYQA